MSYLSIVEMRKELCKLYNGAFKWVDKVNKMSDNQVLATYQSMQKRKLKQEGNDGKSRG